MVIYTQYIPKTWPTQQTHAYPQQWPWNQTNQVCNVIQNYLVNLLFSYILQMSHKVILQLSNHLGKKSQQFSVLVASSKRWKSSSRCMAGSTGISTTKCFFVTKVEFRERAQATAQSCQIQQQIWIVKKTPQYKFSEMSAKLNSHWYWREKAYSSCMSLGQDKRTG